MTKIETVGVLPQMGYGTWKRNGAEGRQNALTAIEAGYPAIDTAAFYENEDVVGAAIRDSGVDRDSLFITTKIWWEELGAGDVRASLEASLKRLGLDHVDLALIHWPSPDGEPLDRYVTELAEATEAGLARHMGVSNFTTSHMDAAAAAIGADRIATNQVELNVFFRNRPIVQHCRGMGVPLTAYLPLSQGRVSDSEPLAQVAARKGATPAQIALAWLLAEGHVAIPSSSNADRIRENLAAAEITLDASDMAALDDAETDSRVVDPEFGPVWDAA